MADRNQNNIDPKLLAVIRAEAQKAAEEVYARKGTMFGVADIPTHTHNGVDSVPVPAANIGGFVPLPATPGGVVNPETLGNQVVIQGSTTRGYGAFSTVSQATFPIYPVPFILGGGNIISIYTLVDPVSAGDTSATLGSSWGSPTATIATAFDSTEVKYVHFTNGSDAITWDTPLQNSAGTGLEIFGDAAFKGGDAPLGTVVMFSALQDLTPQLWVRMNRDGFTDKWWGITLTDAIIGFTL